MIPTKFSFSALDDVVDIVDALPVTSSASIALLPIMPRFQLHGHLRDAKFRASQLRDHPPLMELKSVRDLLNMCDQDLSRYVLKYFKYYVDLDINTGGGTDDVPKDRVDKLQKRIQDWK